MLEKMWRKRNPYPLLVAMYTSTTTMESSIEALEENFKKNCHTIQ
jgi:hypothetical protein